MQMKSICFLLFLSLAAIHTDGQPLRTSWPMIGGDPGRSSFAKLNLQFPAEVKQTIRLGHDRENGMALSEDQIFLGNYGTLNQVIAGDLGSGHYQWTFDVPGTGGGMQFTPAVSEGIVLAGGQNGKGLYARQVLTGDSLWFQPVKGLYTRSPIISSGLVYIAASEGLFCFDLHTGTSVWSFPASLPQIAPVADSLHVYFCSFDTLYAADKYTGELVWKDGAIPVGHFTSLSLDDERIYVGHDTSVNALYFATGQAAWHWESPTSHTLNYYPGAFALNDEILLVKILIDNADDHQYVVLNKATGQLILTYAAAKQYAAPTIINQYVVEFLNGTLRFLDLMTGALAHELTSLPVTNHHNQVIAAQDRIYVAGNGPDVLVIGGQATSVGPPVEFQPIQIYPNPVRDEINITFSLNENSGMRMRLLDMNGQALQDQYFGNVEKGEQQVTMSVTIPNGLYVIEIIVDKGRIVRKVTVMR